MVKKNIKVIQLNAQHKRAASSLLMNEIVENNIDIALIQEPYIDCRNNKIPGLTQNYQAYFASAKATAALIIRKDVKHILLSKVLTDRTVAVKVNTFDKAIIFITCYAPRNELPVPPELEENWSYLRRLSPFIVTGVDSNSHSTLLNYDKSDQRAVVWEEFLSNKNLIIKNIPSAVTFENSRGQVSRIDWTLCTTAINQFLDEWGVPDDWITLSDHKIITFVVKAYPTQTRKKLFNYKKTNWIQFLEKLNDNFDLNLDKLDMPLNSAKEIDDYADLLFVIIHKTMKEVVPQSKHVSHKNAWWNKKLDVLKTQVRKAKRSNNLTNYRNLKIEFENEIFHSKKQSWQKFIQTVESQDDAYIRYKILCKNKSESGLPPVHDENGNLSTSPEESAHNLLNCHFPDFEQNEINDRKVSDTVKNFLHNDCTQLEPKIEEHEIRSAIRSTAPRKSPGIDEIPGLILHKTQNLLLPHLLKLFNGILSTGFYPTSWKKARIIFLKKPGEKDPKNPNHYRPISLLPVISKVFERILQKRLNWFATSCNWINRRQFGFQRNVGAEYCAWNLSNAIMTNFKNKKEQSLYFWT